MSQVVACPSVIILFYEQRWEGGVFKVMIIDHFLVLQVFGKVKEWFIFEVCEMIRVLHLVACPVGFNLLCDRVHQGGMLKLVKK